ncbi:cold-shock protein [Brevibacterium sp. HMSC08F02]|uniref:Cold shock domain-containing protein n=1 Tax=Brevibacterium ravenspurgense TaxID=479117 RepID=A0A150HA69_9MICO|nr:MULTISPECIES: cold shock domain-containing protein [Brevibacterium]KXZ58941.1 Cold shock-like protein CspD [Brevibacterium ravenspurgense]MCG7301066.1 cold shock domain-containing protein [Brevibacterium ravenspurgense]OFT26136.1 cold-shock protein [Brevibacterium sp. HMSC08F02]OFT94264.1 cold-shock protein [Brevibacterium sp. HMSC24B04]OFT97737.1 cold-shock protein [Brevibacterium sp. HMSC22B09]
MPTGRVKWFDSDKGFGFVTGDDGEEFFMHSSSLPDGVTVHKGSRLDFDIVDSRRGRQVLRARLLDAPPRVRPNPEKTADMIQDVISMLDDTLAGLRQGRYPDAEFSAKVAEVLRHVADDLEG